MDHRSERMREVDLVQETASYLADRLETTTETNWVYCLVEQTEISRAAQSDITTDEQTVMMMVMSMEIQ